MLKRPFVAIFALISTLVIFGITGPNIATPVTFWTNPLIFEFLFGIGLALLYKRGFHTTNLFLAMTCFGTGIALLIWLDTMALPRVIAAGIPAAIIVASGTMFCPDRVFPFQRLGDASYAVYLSHRFVLRGATLLVLPFLPGTQIGAWLYVVTVVSLATLVGILTHLLLERPIMRSMSQPLRASTA